MIGVRVDGRLGNQMFQYAFAIALSEKLKTRFYISQFLWDNLLYQYFELPSNTKWINEIVERYFWKELKYIEDKDFDITNWQEVCNENNVVYQGYMQSLQYFESAKYLITKEFEIKQIWTNQFNKKYANLFTNNKIIVIHVRKSDYNELGYTIPFEYYIRCLNLIPAIDSYTKIFISDDLSYCKNVFKHIKNAQFEENSEIIDMQLLINADICILANSSFSWWGAFLNNKPQKKVYYPKYWLGYNQKSWMPTNAIGKNLNWVAIHNEELI